MAASLMCQITWVLDDVEVAKLRKILRVDILGRGGAA
jgi:hypothetical protein